MKLLIALALIGMASAVEEVQPVVLPEAPAPAYETGVPVVEPIDISLLMVPQEVVDELQRVQTIEEIADEVPADTIRFVDNSEDITDDVHADTIRFVDNSEDNSDDVPADTVRFVDNSEDVPSDTVMIVDIAEESPFPVNDFEKIAESELESIRVAIPDDLQDIVLPQDIVQVADLPLPEETPRGYPGKTYPDPTWR